MVNAHLRTIASFLLVLVLAACGGNDGDDRAKSEERSAATDNTEASDATDIATDEAEPGKSEFGPDDDDLIIEAALADVEAYWKDTFPALYGGEYSPLSGGAVPYGPDDPPPNCSGPGEASYADVAENAFYCGANDMMAWDTDNLTNGLLNEFGPFTLGIVVAHEIGHKIQADHGILDGRFVTFLTEQQADCFAGAWTKYVAEGNSDLFELSLGDLDSAIGGFLKIRDPIGTDVVSASAHGSAFQRINAFEDGLMSGAERCKDYEDGSFNVVPEVFTDTADLEAGGNLPFDQVEPLVLPDLERFWSTAFVDIGLEWTQATINAYDPDEGVECGDETAKGDDAVGLVFYCPDDDTLNWDEVKLMPAVHDEVGDLAMAALIANLYSERAQTLAGLQTGTLDANLQIDCFTGVWVATTATQELGEELQLSPGDLDEAVAAFLQFSTAAADGEAGETDTASAFQRLDAFRAGFFDAFTNGYNSGLSGCVGGAGAKAASHESD